MWLHEGRAPDRSGAAQPAALAPDHHAVRRGRSGWFAALFFGVFNWRLRRLRFELGRGSRSPSCSAASPPARSPTCSPSGCCARSRPARWPPGRSRTRRCRGLTARTMFAWALGSGIPLLGLCDRRPLRADRGGPRPRPARGRGPALAGGAIVVGFFAILFAARVTADPIISVRHAVAEIERGDLDVEVPVYDGSELGMLQSGFNQMVDGPAGARAHPRPVRPPRRRGRRPRGARARGGPRRREPRGRDPLHRHDRLDRARVRAAAGPRSSSCSTTSSASSSRSVDEHGGWVNKFEGDAALAVFGAPAARSTTPPGSALAAAREMAERLERRGRGGRGRDRRLLRRGRRRQHRRRRALRVHGDRRRGQRGGAADGSRQGARRAGSSLLRRGRGGERRRGRPMGAWRRGRAARQRAADPPGHLLCGAESEPDGGDGRLRQRAERWPCAVALATAAASRSEGLPTGAFAPATLASGAVRGGLVARSPYWPSVSKSIARSTRSAIRLIASCSVSVIASRSKVWMGPDVHVFVQD